MSRHTVHAGADRRLDDVGHAHSICEKQRQSRAGVCVVGAVEVERPRAPARGLGREVAQPGTERARQRFSLPAEHDDPD